ncbi:MAG: isoleucine--tRNA ligase [Myxococcales bacterium]|nr:isoleucine--tRNA ligase [Myxococcales bacterium]
MAAFPPLTSDPDFPRQEAEILQLWERISAFERSVEQRSPDRSYVFYDGPPFATGLPHYGHLVPGTIKDAVPRYWTMRGYRVERRFGWDTHGLPIEMLMEKELGLSGPSEVREYGVAEFNEACRGGVLKYVDEWRRIVGRLGRWVDFDDDYKTMDATFMESVWWAFRQLWDKGLIYREFRVMPYSWRLSTSLSNFEANLDYREVQDPAITVTMPSKVGSDVFLVWTTTPWTLPSNLAIAVGSELTYVRAKIEGDDRVFVVAEDRLQAVLGKDATVIETVTGADLLGASYEPLFPYFADHPNAFVVIASDHVTTEDGTGLVHMAPDFGEDDYAASKKHGISVLQSVDDEGRFTDAVGPWAGRNIKEADADIIKALKKSGRLLRHDTLVHSYPFCWRSDTPLIYRAVPAWFVKVTEIKDRMVANNERIRWVPEAVGSKRFGNWLADARDWNVSRNRFWGTPIPIWQCDADESHRLCVGSIAELQERTSTEVDDLHPHKIDHLTFDCTECGGTMHRISDVFDCWFESGSMPYGQAHYPFENKESFEANYPAQFISEGLDQTRGWFYTLLVLSTALFDEPSFLTCVVNGMVLAEDGSKMSKSKQNFPPPEEILDQYGADALRAYLINSPVVRAEPLKFSEAGVREVVRTVLLPLHNAHGFFVQYANIDGWDPSAERPAVAARAEIDRWLVSHLQSLIAEVDAQMEQSQLYNVVPPVLRFIDDLTNWYIRLCRRRFWRSVDDIDGQADKAAAYATLYETLVTFAKVLAPFLPFEAEGLYQSLVVQAGCQQGDQDSVHLCDWPTVSTDVIDAALERQVADTREVVRLGRRLRERHRLKTRQPLRAITVVHHDADARAGIEAHAELLAEELNVKEVRVVAEGDELATLTCKPNFKTLGRRYGKEMKQAAAVISGWGASEWAQLQAGEELSVLDQPVTADDVIVRRDPRPDVVIETEGSLIVALDTELDDALLREGIAREFVSAVQKQRRDDGLAVTDRIRLTVHTRDSDLREAIEHSREWVSGEVLAVQVEVQDADGSDVTLATVKGSHDLSLTLAADR